MFINYNILIKYLKVFSVEQIIKTIYDVFIVGIHIRHSSIKTQPTLIYHYCVNNISSKKIIESKITFVLHWMIYSSWKKIHFSFTSAPYQLCCPCRILNI